MLAGLLNDFRNQPGGGSWALFHMDHHRAIATALQTKYQISVVVYPLDNMPLDNFSQWLRTHQAMHDALSQFAGIASNDLSHIDLKDEFSVGLWLQQNFSEHQAAEQLLGIQG